MKQKLTFFAALMMAMAIPQSVRAYSFSSICSSGQTLYYNITQNGYNGVFRVEVTYYNTTSNPWPVGSPAPTGALIIPDSVTYNGVNYTVVSIGNSAFKNCDELTSVTIPSSVEAIGSDAFYNCSSLIGTLIIRNSVTSIGSFAFANCSSLSSITIGSNVSTIGFMAFYCVRHIEYHGNATGAPWSANSINGITEGDFVYSSTEKDTLIAYIGNGGCITIPSTVIAIGNNAFRAYTGLMSVIFPSTLTYIGWDAFEGCSGLTGTLVIPNTVTTIQGRAFYGCIGLSGSLYLPDSLTLLGNHAFYGCNGLTGCLYIGNKITTIDTRTFYGCSGLTSTIIGNSVSSIGYESFYGCSGLSVIYTLPNEAPSLDYGSFNGLSDSVVVNIPCGSSASYTYLWTTSTLFTNSNFEENRPGFHIRSNDTVMGSVLIQDFPTCQNTTAVFRAIANVGYKFLSWSDGNTEKNRTITLIQDTTITAIFDVCDTIFIHDTTYVIDWIYDTTYIDIHDTTFIDVPYAVHDTVYINVPYAVHDTTIIVDTLILTEYVPVHDTTYVPVHDTTYITLTDTLTTTLYDTIINTVFDTIDNYIHDTTIVTDTLWLTQYDTIDNYIHDTTYIDVHDTTYITLTDTVTNNVYDTIDNYIHDTTIVTDTLWLTQYDTIWMHDTITVHDTIYITEEGIGDVETLNAKVYSSQGQIVVEGADGNMVTLYDISGRVLATRRDEYAPLRFDVPASGTYMLKIGNHPARKVVVIR